MKTALIILLILSLTLIGLNVLPIFGYYGIVVFLIGATFEVIDLVKKKSVWFLESYLLDRCNQT